MAAVLEPRHIAAVVLLLGNIVTGPFRHAHAARTRDARFIAHAMEGIIRSDRLFTMPGVAVIGHNCGMQLHDDPGGRS